jgi:hypothetical protein
MYYYNDKYIWVYALFSVSFIVYNTHKTHKQVYIYIIQIIMVLNSKYFINIILTITFHSFMKPLKTRSKPILKNVVAN